MGQRWGVLLRENMNGVARGVVNKERFSAGIIIHHQKGKGFIRRDQQEKHYGYTFYGHEMVLMLIVDVGSFPNLRKPTHNGYSRKRYWDFRLLWFVYGDKHPWLPSILFAQKYIIGLRCTHVFFFFIIGEKAARRNDMCFKTVLS